MISKPSSRLPLLQYFYEGLACICKGAYKGLKIAIKPLLVTHKTQFGDPFNTIFANDSEILTAFTWLGDFILFSSSFLLLLTSKEVKSDSKIILH